MIPSTDDIETFGIEIGSDEAGQRIDKLLSDALEDVSRSQLQDWIRDGHVLVNGAAVKPNYKVAASDEVVVRPPDPAPTELVPENIPLDVVYEDRDVIVVNKPRGMVVHPAVGHPSGTLVNALMYHCKDLSGINGEIRPGIVHRIDKDTSGLLMAAKNDVAHTSLAAQLKEHSVTRRYVAVVHGVLEHDQGTVDAPIGRDPQDRKLFTVTDKGARHAVTHFVVTERFPEFTVLELLLETGRTHQIRVHMKFIGHPLVGDPVYGRSKGRTMEVPGQALHAAVLGFTHPRTGERLTFEAPLPSEMQSFIEQLRLM
ncbi:RluA family pseudouridine synthase [Paenibacillus sp.]|uniref:RluA family pseudouridine synthase n=1 Tax=Paenibacillus sp. TaxID=58172 RepID=UPI0028123EE1|nr:RluA family pseudouridine synthase [Paenibacillus sp.]